MNISELLPIGSVVLLNGGKKKVMIFGVKQTDKASKKEYDYISVMYPEGALGESGQFLFNQEDVAEVLFRGYEDEERKAFLDKLSVFYNKNSK